MWLNAVVHLHMQVFVYQAILSQLFTCLLHAQMLSLKCKPAPASKVDGMQAVISTTGGVVSRRSHMTCSALPRLTWVWESIHAIH